jgi:hypothetical protein
MKKIFLISSILLIFIAGCSKKKTTEVEPVMPDIEVTDRTAVNFIQDLKVEGAQTVTYDSVLRAYQVVLPESYTKDFITLNVILYPQATVSFRSPEKFDFYYRARSNGVFEVSQDKETKSFKLYVKHLAPLKVTVDLPYGLRSDLDGNCSVAVTALTGIGTIPESPDDKKELTVTLKDEETSKTINGTYALSGVYFNQVNDFFNSDKIAIEMKYGEKSVVLVNNQKFSRAHSVVSGIEDVYSSFLAAPVNEKLNVRGRDFTGSSRYEVKIESDFTEPAIIPVRFENENALQMTLPATLAKGSYSLSFFENGEMINRISKVISSDKKEKSIGQMWKSQHDYPTATSDFYSSGKLVVERGMPIFANPLPVTLGAMYSGFDTTVKLPDLQLKNSGQTITIKADLKGDTSYGDATLILYYGRYDIPANLQPGMYEAKLIYADKSESLSYWNKIQVK